MPLFLLDDLLNQFYKLLKFYPFSYLFLQIIGSNHTIRKTPRMIKNGRITFKNGVKVLYSPSRKLRALVVFCDWSVMFCDWSDMFCDWLKCELFSLATKNILEKSYVSFSFLNIAGFLKRLSNRITLLSFR